MKLFFLLFIFSCLCSAASVHRRCIRDTKDLLKQAYAGKKGADIWKRSAGQSAKKGASEDVTLFSKRVAPELNDHSVIVDIGPGDGAKGDGVIAALKDDDLLASTYIAADFSDDVIEMATENVGRAHPDMLIEGVSIDLLKKSYWGVKSLKEKKVFVFLGSTLGNFNDMAMVLKNIRKQMNPGDVLYVSVYKYRPRKIKAELDLYGTGDFQSFLKNALIGNGFDPSQGTINVSFDKQGKDVVATFSSSGGETTFFKSHRFTADEIVGLFEEAGFEDVTVAEGSGRRMLGCWASR